jgi:PadR family transcriptional regulator PadR
VAEKTHLDAADPEWKKGSAELLVLSLLEDQPRHGYDISKLIERRSGGALRFHVTSLYPLLHRLERQGWIIGRWVEKADQRRRRCYSLTSEGRAVLRAKHQSWKDFVALVNRITGVEHG